MDQAISHKSWPRGGRTADAQLGQVVRNATHFASSLRAEAFRVNAFDVRLGDTRRTACAGFAVRAFFAFTTQVEGRFLFPFIGTTPRDAAAGRVGAAAELSEDHEMQTQGADAFFRRAGRRNNGANEKMGNSFYPRE